MPDIFTDGTFVELPSVSIFDDCTEWLPVLEAGFEWLVQTNRIANATDDEIETARIEIMDWLGPMECPVFGVEALTWTIDLTTFATQEDAGFEFIANAGQSPGEFVAGSGIRPTLNGQWQIRFIWEGLFGQEINEIGYQFDVATTGFGRASTEENFGAVQAISSPSGLITGNRATGTISGGYGIYFNSLPNNSRFLRILTFTFTNAVALPSQFTPVI